MQGRKIGEKEVGILGILFWIGNVAFFEGACSVTAGFSPYYISYSFVSNYTNIISPILLFSYFLYLISNIWSDLPDKSE